MKIEKIELAGFKSFSEKTTFTLHPGITCIIGPNGCGKSNILDAFRWVLGEQSAKTLRGERMDEVIFNGSQVRKPRGMAEVSLYLSFPEEGNGDQPAKPVTITRRLYRSGESEYLINRQACRLRDIREMFLDTGLEMKSYSIIEQGKIGELINAKPQDRRFLIDEVAGVMKYRVRKAEAQSKLDSSRINLQRVTDIMAEVKRQLNSLNRQAKKAERYKKVAEEFREVELRLARTDFISMDSRLQDLLSRLTQLSDNDAQRRAAVSDTESTIEKSKLLLLEKERMVSEIIGRLQQVEESINTMERQSAVNRKEVEHLGSNLTSLNGLLEELKRSVDEKGLRLNNFSGQETELQKGVDSQRDLLSNNESSLNEIEFNTSALNEEIDEKRGEIFRLTDAIATYSNILHRAEATREGLSKRGLSLERERAETDRRLAELRKELEETGSGAAVQKERIKGLAEERDRLLSDLSASHELSEELKNERSALREEIASIRSRMKSLEEIVTGNLDSDMVHDAGIKFAAALSEVMDLQPKHEKAVEAALSDKVKGFILSTKDDIKKSVNLVNQNNLPRTAFISMETAAGSGSPPEIEGSNCTPLNSLVHATGSFIPLVQRLLSDYMLVDNMDDAFAILRKQPDIPSSLRLVTVNGEVIEPGGVVVCGRSTGVLELRRELRELQSQTEDKESASRKAEASLHECSSKIEGLKSSLGTKDLEIISEEKELSSLQASERRLSDEEKRFKQKLEFLQLEMDELQKETVSTDQDISIKKEEIRAGEETKESLETGMDALQEDFSSVREEIDAKRQSITDLRIKLNGDIERLRSIMSEKRKLENDIRDLQEKRSELSSEIERTGKRITEREADSAEIEEKLENAVSDASGLRENVETERNLISELRESVNGLEEGLKKDRDALESLSRDLHNCELQKTEVSIKLSNLEESIAEKYRVDLQNPELPVSDAYDDDSLIASELGARIESMGSVNIGALDEFNELSQRHEFLDKQHSDISLSIDELEDAIKKINRTTKKRLRDAFDALNSKFNEIFTMLFGGGSAEIELTDEENILESGIVIKVQPPGKKLQNLSLLSGGEKALAALSILFAGFLLKPTPLCILDEADAPLDESNTERFRSMIKDIAEGIQFIVITHNRITMEASDYLYGITMEEPGTSKVLSMELAE